MKKFALIFLSLLLPVSVFAHDERSHVLTISLGVVILVLLSFVIAQKMILKSTKQDIFEILKGGNSSLTFHNKTAMQYDLQEVFLYFFRTLAHEASLNNHVFLVRQKMLLKNHDDALNSKNSLADMIKPAFLQDVSSNLLDDNLSDSNLDPTRKLSRPVRHFFGDYSDVISCIYQCVNLLASQCSNKIITIDINELAGPDNQLLLSVEVSLCEPEGSDTAKIFGELMNPTSTETIMRLNRFKAELDRCTCVKYFIKDSSARPNSCITLTYPLVVADYNQPNEVAPNYILKALVMHEHTDIARCLVQNLNDFNIDCVYNRSSQGLIDRATDGVNFPYRAVILDSQMFMELQPAEQMSLLRARIDNNFELVLVLANHIAASKIPSELTQHMFFLPLPYTVDNIRALVSAMVTQHERLHS